MGRLAVRALRHQPNLQLVHINEHKGGADTAAHLLEFDSVHGRYQGTVATNGEALVIDGAPVTFTAHSNPADEELGEVQPVRHEVTDDPGAGSVPVVAPGEGPFGCRRIVGDQPDPDVGDPAEGTVADELPGAGDRRRVPVESFEFGRTSSGATDRQSPVLAAHLS